MWASKNEVEERRLHLKAACSSLFDYCVRRLKLSESEAFHRITAARLARRFPVIFELLEARSIHLSALRILRDHLTRDNHRGLLAAASGKSKKEVEALVAALAPRPDVAPLIRRLPTARRVPSSPSSAVAEVASPAKPCSSPALPSTGEASSAAVLVFHAGADRERASSSSDPLAGKAASAPSSSRTQTLEPLSSARYLLRVSVSREFTEKLERVGNLMSHANPSGELDTMLERALDLLLEKLEKQRFGQTKRSGEARKVPMPLENPHRTSKTGRSRQRTVLRLQSADSLERDETPSPQSVDIAQGDSQLRDSAQLGGIEGSEPESARPKFSSKAEEVTRVSGAAPAAKRKHREHIPSEVRRAVALRDGFQCTYRDDEGHRCPSRAFLQLHHEQAHALGGPATFDNLRLLCGSHNRLLAERDFGRAHQERVIRRNPESNVERVRSAAQRG